ncbi:MAG: ABC transporter transmembrane domain-containing protein, partial [Acidimicrobiia bacterium]|nr:ABC transporter transmembrane domain-containing protein [Acidimicrobiia bacterium]
MQSTPTARWRALGALLRPDARRWLALGALVAGGAALALTGPLIVREVVDRATAGTTSGEITELAIAFLVVALLTQLLAVIVVQFATVSAWRTTNGLRLQLTDHVLGLDHEFHRKHTPGELIQRVDGDVTAVSDFLSLVVPRALGAALLVTGMVGVLAFLDWRLAIGMAVYVAITVAIVVRSRHRAVGEASE